MVGRRHQRKTRASQGSGGGCQKVPDGICGACCGRRASLNHQQSVCAPKFAPYDHQHALGALLAGGTASQGPIDSRCVPHLCQQLDCPALGQSASPTNQDCRGRTLASSDGSGRWNQSQNQVRDVGLVFARCSLGVLLAQSDLIRHSGWEWGQTRPKHRRANQRQTSEITFGFVTRTGQVWLGRTGISGSASGVSRRGPWDSSRRTWGSALGGMRFREHELQRSTLVLLASRWEPEEHQNGSICKAATDASKPETLLAGVEVAKPLQQTGRFRVPFRKTARQQAVRSSFSVKEEDSACIQTDRYHGCGLAHVSALCWKHAGGDGRTSAHDPRLLAAQQPSCHEQVFAGNIEDQTLGTGQIGRRYFADGYIAEDKPNPMSAVWNRFRTGPFSFGAYRPLTSPDLPDIRVASA